MNIIVIVDTIVSFEEIAAGDRADRRSREKTAVNFILRQLFGPGEKLVHDACGAPHLSKRSDLCISISHSQTLAVVAVNSDYYVGIDTEELRGAQLARVKDRYLSAAEQLDWTTTDDLLTAWCIKEAAYKVACAMSHGAVATMPGLDYTRDFVIDRSTATVKIPMTDCKSVDTTLCYTTVNRTEDSVTVLVTGSRKLV